MEKEKKNLVFDVFGGIYTRNMKEFTFQQVWPLLERPVRKVYQALEDGIEKANVNDEDTTYQPCPIRWASNVRSRVAKLLSVEVLGDDFEFNLGFNLSLSIHSELTSLRVLKAALGDLPNAKGSPGRRAYFDQLRSLQLNLPFEDDEAEAAQVEPEFAPNFVLVWFVNSLNKLCSLVLAYPKPLGELLPDGTEPKQEWFWCEQVLNLVAADSSTPDIFHDVPGVELAGDGSKDPDDEEKGDESTGTN